MINGVNSATFFILPMLGKHYSEYPRFRDCFTKNKEHPEHDGCIHVYTRVGGGNRDSGYGEEELYEDPNFITSFDDSFDGTYATYVFRVPQQWKADFEKITAGKVADVSEEYQKELRRVYPKLKDTFNKIFKSTKTFNHDSSRVLN